MIIFKSVVNSTAGALASRLLYAIAACLPTLTVNAQTSPFEGPSDELIDLSLEELLNVEVTSVSRRSQSLSTAAAAAFVVTEQDIRRSGATTIPDVLRMVPGINVAQIDGNKWAVTARGFNGRFAGKLLVLMDGRTIYSPLFSGVFWDLHDVSLESIERIEVIRGPGATLWGANAVNGIINIITKSAGSTQGGFVHAGVSNTGGNAAVLRYGGAVSESTDYRVYAKYSDRDPNQDTLGNPVADSWQSARLGLRTDSDLSPNDHLMFIAEAYDGTLGETVFDRSPLPPYETVVDAEEQTNGYYAQLAWSRSLANESQMTLQAYYDHSEREAYFYDGFTVDTVDIDFQHGFRAGDRHELVWGLGFRYTDDEMVSGFSMGLDPASRSQTWASAFLQDEIELSADNVYLTVGAKFDHNSFSQNDVEVQPTIRIRFNAGESGTAWASISRAIRLPSRGDLDGRAVSAVIPPLVPPNQAPVPLVIGINGNPEQESEELIAYEFGYRRQASDNTAIDIALFYHDHNDERSAVQGAPLCMPSGIPTFVDPTCVLSAQYVDASLNISSDAANESYGMEVVVDWTPTDDWRLQTVYSGIQFADSRPPVGFATNFVQPTPEHQLSLRSLMNVGSNSEFDVWLRYVDELESISVDEYVELDARFGWSPSDRLQLSIVGRNLLDEAHQEFNSEIRDIVPVAIERRAYVEMRWSF